MDVDVLVQATASFCCTPPFVFRDDDPTEADLSALARRKFYVVKKGASGGEGVYSHWDLAEPQISGISGALHESCNTADQARQIWAKYCHQRHAHSTPEPQLTRVSAPRVSAPRVSTRMSVASPPAYSPTTPPASPQLATTTPSRRRPQPTPRQFFRVPGSPRVLLGADEAEAEWTSTGGTGCLLVVNTLADVEDDDEVVSSETRRFYRVFGSPRVQRSRAESWPAMCQRRPCHLTGAGRLAQASIRICCKWEKYPAHAARTSSGAIGAMSGQGAGGLGSAITWRGLVDEDGAL
ncbi:hypothetical protein K438DRAFT_1750274 [Mycena galopus ATCC 62051]|nr:hypothetical protein K438DRAFT_1767509 [Mycena galopus ATCC 62051]KAF8214214.1 hypothetical protein K438DRAFT_1750274 [Mycena galopus ATCC 62051]